MSLPSEFGTMVFNDSVMRARLPADIYEAMKKTVNMGTMLDPGIADEVAAAMRDWAIEKGATHYTHWFQPLSGVTAEKHDSFISPSGDGGYIMEFSGRELIRGESDASSFPSGGLRATFEARGYTAWDPTSFAFIKEDILCVPTAFCSYGGEALDMKTPLLRSMAAVNREALRLLKLFGARYECVTPTVGAEQEYFLIDREIYNERRDISYTGRTLFGAKPPKGQELDDHYYGSIRLRISAFMKDLNKELWKLGIFAKTEHNEAAPAQHELAEVYSTANVATDHNQLTMEIMRKVAKRHSLTCLLHEKPFEGVNGSGKHNNWALATDTGVNLLNPGETPFDNAQFLTFLVAVIRAVNEYQDLLRISVASAGNDHRLGANEAPPAIISIYIGEELSAILEALESGTHYDKVEVTPLRVGVDALPPIPKDSTDRNRTSPFAFTGNKFEFRMPGASQSIASPNTVLNTIVADSLGHIADELTGAEDFHTALDELIRTTIRENKRIIFNGNGYSKDWEEEALRRGLSNYVSTAEALPHFTDAKNVALFERHGVFSRGEMRSRLEIMLQSYSKEINIEARTMLDIARRDILPAVIGFSKLLAETINAKNSTQAGISAEAETRLLKRISKLADELYLQTGQLAKAVDDAAELRGDEAERSRYFRDVVFTAMNDLRATADELEMMVGNDYWPYPSYGTILYKV